ncbi:MAG TPA: O-methyltransferase [Candidatus Barnesiella excrementavium]|nr:O-methyltransferase [Candidatus Barnesiella excrementavium]
MTPELEEYILNHIDKEDELLATLDRDTHLYHLRPRMVSGHLQGRILKMFCRMIRPQRILELGTFTGYSALCLAEGLCEGGEVHTIEIDDEIEDFTRSHLARSPYGNRIKLMIGDAVEIVPTLSDTYDLVFIDANKRDYLKYYELVLPKVRPEGFILADNTLWDGKVVTDPHSRDAQTVGIERFNDFIATDNRVEKVILPLRDGLTILWKKP